jgi:hypothetical protein
MPIALLHVVHNFSRIISDEALKITSRWPEMTVIVGCVYWYGRIQVSTVPRGLKRWLFYIGTLAMLAWGLPGAVPLAFFALWYGDASARRRQAKIMEAARDFSSMDPEDHTSLNAAVNKYAGTLSRYPSTKSMS